VSLLQPGLVLLIGL